MNTSKATNKKTNNPLTDIDVIAKNKRVDGGIDYLINVCFKNGEKSYLPIRVNDDNIMSCYWTNTDHQQSLAWVTLAKKRTLKANCKTLLKEHPQVLSEHSNIIYELNKDDRAARKKIHLSKRKWRIHEVSFFNDGFFVARLSCTKASKDEFIDNQFILYPSSYQDDNNNRGSSSNNINLYSSHGSLITAFKCNANVIKRSLNNELYWDELGEALSCIEHGYNTEVEAKAGYKYIVSTQKTRPLEVTRFNKRNAVKQHSIDKNIKVEVCDYYKNNHTEAWLIKSTGKYYIAETAQHVPGAISLKGMSITTAFTSIQDSACDLISQHRTKGYSEKDNSKVRQDWVMMIREDFRQRYFIQNLRSTWHITHVASNTDNYFALKAICLPEPNLIIPSAFQAHTYHVLYLTPDENKILDPSREEKALSFIRENPKQFKLCLKALVEPDDSDLNYQVKMTDILRFSHGFASQLEADNVWGNITRNSKTHVINGDICPISKPMREQQIAQQIKNKRADIKKRIDGNTSQKNILIEFDSRIKKISRYSKQLLDLGIEKRVCSHQSLQEIETLPNEYSDELIVDLFNTTPMQQDNKLNTSSDSDMNVKDDSVNGINNSTLQEYSTTKKSNAGRKRLYKDDTERKREWARKNREAKRQQLATEGVKPKKRGPIQQHATQADKQSAYRFRKKWNNYCNDSALLYVGMQATNDDIHSLIQDVLKLVPFFEGDEQHIKAISVLPKTDINTLNNTITDKCQPNNVYNIKTQDDFNQIKSSLEVFGVKRVLFCGSSLTENMYRLALYLQENGYEPCFIKHCLYSNNDWELETGLKLFKNKFGAKNIL